MDIDELPEEDKKLFYTKGLVFILPDNIKAFLLPRRLIGHDP